MAGETYSRYKVAELKELVKQRGITSAGLTRKQQYIDALEADDAVEVDDDDDDDDDDDALKVEDDDAVEADNTLEADGSLEAGDMHEAVADGGDDEAVADGGDDEAVADGGDDEAVASGGHHEAVAPTPPTATPDASSETRKRKRRSPTPPIHDEDVNNKKRKTAAEQEPAVLTGGAVIEDAPAPTDGPAGVVPPDGSGDESSIPQADTASEEDGTRAVHPATRALYIRELIRPLQAHQLQTHLARLAAAPGDAPDASTIIETCHLDTMRTHALVIFTSAAAAARARSTLHHTVWPDEPTRKPLWVDFVPPDHARQWIEREQADGRDRRNARRWEVVYHPDAASGEVVATWRQVPHPVPPPTARTPSIPLNTAAAAPHTSATPLLDPIPTGPRADRRPSPLSNPVIAPPPPRRPESPVQSRKLPPPSSTDSFNILDQRFQSTSAKPKLYFQPVAPDTADDRLRELQRTTSRHGERARPGRPGPGLDGQLRRYTFEDGHHLVDGGPDRGNFGVPDGYFVRGAGGRGGRRGRRGRW